MEKPIANNALVLNRHGRRANNMAVYGRLPDPARLDHAASPNHIFEIRRNVQMLPQVRSKRRGGTV
tara:strand:- start:35 stop:232 length:198 start_codon:yes stop_codon:yes gene_type:complete